MHFGQLVQGRNLSRHPFSTGHSEPRLRQAAGVSPRLRPAVLSRSDMDWISSRRAIPSTRNLPNFGSVMRTIHHSLPWRVAGLPEAEDGAVIEDFLIALAANDCSPQTLRSYAFDLLRWWRF